VGEDVTTIPGIKKKNFSDGVTKSEYKSELKSILKYVVENDISELIYGPWMIFWFNREWDLGEEEEDSYLGSSIEVIYSPQRICLANVLGKNNYEVEESDFDRLENMLKKAIDSENYELASKIRDIIKVQDLDPKQKKDI